MDTEQPQYIKDNLPLRDAYEETDYLYSNQDYRDMQ